MYQLLSDLKDCLQDCFEQTDCGYSFLISMGIPPADCSTIALWLDSSRRNRSDNNECCTSVYDTQINITITRCCLVSARGEVWNPLLEEQDMECFLADICRLRECLSCNGCTIPGIGCGLQVLDVSFDREVQGGCYSATISVNVVEDCCGASE